MDNQDIYFKCRNSVIENLMTTEYKDIAISKINSLISECPIYHVGFNDIIQHGKDETFKSVFGEETTRSIQFIEGDMYLKLNLSHDRCVFLGGIEFGLDSLLFANILFETPLELPFFGIYGLIRNGHHTQEFIETLAVRHISLTMNVGHKLWSAKYKASNPH